MTEILSMADLRLVSGQQPNDVVFLKGYRTVSDGGEGTFYWNSTSTITDNGGTIIKPTGSTASGRWIRMFNNFISVKWFGAYGDGVNDDADAINTAICFAKANSIATIGKVWIPAGNYAIGCPIKQRDGVEIVGEVGQQPQSAGGGQAKTMVTLKAISTMPYMFKNEENHKRTDQTGLESGTLKSIVTSSLSNVYFNANRLAQWCIYWFECWNGTFSNVRANNSTSYSVSFFDTNEAIVNNCNFTGVLLDSVADSIFTANTFTGSVNFPALVLRDTNYNTISSGLIYFGTANDSAKILKVTSVDDSGLFTIDPSQTYVLSTDPDWKMISPNAGTLSWDSDLSSQLITYQITTTTPTAQNQIIGTNLPANGTLVVGQKYKVTGIVRLLDTSDSSSIEVNFSTGNSALSYHKQVVERNTPVTINGPATEYNQSSTNPLVIQFKGPAAGKTDNWEFQDIKLELVAPLVNVGKEPYVFSIAGGILPAKLLGPGRLSLGASFYIDFASGSTFHVASSRANYKAGKWVTPVSHIDSFTDLFISPPQAVLAITDSSAANTITGNKIEDIMSTGVLLKSAYNNIISGNTIMKARLKDGVKLISLEAGSMDNQFTGNIINRRLITVTDKAAYCVYIDPYSYRNHFSGNRTGNARIIDIYDSYQGTAENSNRFDQQTIDNALVFQKKPIDYIAANRGVTIPIGIVQPLPTTAAILNYPEFTLFFKDVIFYDDNASVLFTQDNSAGSSASGYVVINKNSAKKLEYKIDGTAIVTSTVVFNKGQAYDIAIVKLGTKTVQIYVDGIFNQEGSADSYVEAPTTGSIAIIGGGFSAQTGSLSIAKFRYYSDSMTGAEVATLSVAGRYDKMKWNCSNIAVDGTFSTTPQTTFSSLASYIRQPGGGIVSSEAAIEFPESYTMVLGSPSGLFVVGETVTGATSGFTAIVAKALTTVNGISSIIVYQIAGMFTVNEIVTGSTSGDTGSFKSNTHLGIAALGPIDRTTTYRVSVWAKSSDLTKISALSLSRDYNYSVVYNLTTGYTKIVFYMPPAWESQTNTLNANSLGIAGVLAQLVSTSQDRYINSTLGTLTLSRFRIDKNGPPLEILFDFMATETAPVFLNENPNAVINNGIVSIISKIQGAELSYTETVSWVATSAPGGTSINTYEWTKIGRMVTLNITLKYSSAGSGITEALCPLPAGLPQPVLRSGFAYGDYVYPGVGGFATASTAPITPSSRVDLRVVSATSAVLRGIVVTGASFVIFRATVTYWAAY